MKKKVIISVLLVILVCCIEAIALVFVKEGTLQTVAASSFIYAAVVIPIVSIIVKYEGEIGMINFFWNVFSTLIMFLIGVMWFHEKLTCIQIIGIVISLLGLALVLL